MSASERSKKDSASEAWPWEVRSFLGPKTSLPKVWSLSRGSAASAETLYSSKDAGSRSDQPIPKLGTVVASVRLQCGDGDAGEQAGSIGKPLIRLIGQAPALGGLDRLNNSKPQ